MKTSIVGLIVGLSLLAIAVTAVTAKTGDLVVINGGTGAVVRVDSATGAQTLITTITGGTPQDVALEASGTLLVTMYSCCPNGNYSGTVIRVDPATGSQVILSSGGLLCSADGVAVAKDGTIVIADGCSAAPLIQIDPGTGAQVAVPVSADGLLSFPNGVVVMPAKSGKP